jgi:LmbE family N-acetylglucosaminyl deacetylase
MERAILLAFAHPDDESFGVAGTVMKYSRQGVVVDLVCATRGEKGTRLGVPEGVETGVAREAELRNAVAIMGIRNIYFLGYIDGEVAKADIGEITEKVVDIMNKVKPEVVITFGPDGITGHSDHIMVGKAATAAFNRLSSENGGPRKLYYVTLPRSAVLGQEDLGVSTRPDEEITLAVDVSQYLERKIQTIAVHKTQQDAYDFIELLRQNQDSDFVSKEFYYLAYPQNGGKEADLFE